MNFEYDLKRGEDSEEMLCYVLEANGCTDVTLNRSDDYEVKKTHDVEFTKDGISYSGELKTDFMSDQTGNVAIEYRCSGKKSGIASTKADFWFTKLSEGFFVIRVERLKKWLRENLHRFRDVQGGDRDAARIILVPKHEFIPINKKLKYENDS